jgi:hypothetical protein
MKSIIIVLRVGSHILRISQGVQIANIVSEQQVGIVVRKQIKKGFDINSDNSPSPP